MRYIFVELVVGDGYRKYHLKELIATKAKSIEFAILWYMVHCYGEGWIDRSSRIKTDDPETLLKNILIWFDNEITVSLYYYKELTKETYNILKQYI